MSTAAIACLAHDSLCSVDCNGRKWTPKVLADKKSLEYFNELKRFAVTIYGYECYNEVRSALRAWVTHAAAKFFFDEMDYFDTSDATISAKYEIFRVRLDFPYNTLMSNIIAYKPFFVLGEESVGKPWFDPLAIIQLWKKMGLSVDKTGVWIEEYYGIVIRCAGDRDTDSVKLKHNFAKFNPAYLKNLTELGRKQLEVFVENTRIEFQIAMNRLEIATLTNTLRKDHATLTTRLDAHVAEYGKMKKAFDESVAANKALQAKVAAQDLLIADLSTKMAKLVDLFGWFKEEAPRTMLRGLADKVVLRLEEAVVAPTIPLVQKIPVPLALKGVVTDDGL